MCEQVVCGRRAGRPLRAGGSAQPKTRTPRNGKIEYYGKTMVAECEQEKNKHGTSWDYKRIPWVI